VNPAGIGQTLPQGVEYVRILPEIVLSLFGMLIMVLDPLVMSAGARDCWASLP
jgi:hypothetical protein